MYIHAYMHCIVHVRSVWASEAPWTHATSTPPPCAVPPIPCTPELESHWLLEGACDVIHVSLSRHQVHGGRELVPGCDLVGEGGGHIHIRTYRCTHAHMHAHTHTHTHARTHMAVVCDLHLDSLWGAAPGTCAHMYTHTNTYTRARTHARTHAHTS